MKKAMAVLVSMGLIAASGSALAQMDDAPMDGGPAMHQRHGKGEHGMFKNLNLSAEQKARMKALRPEHREPSAAEKQARMAQHRQMQALIEAPSFDAARARELVRSNQNERIDREVDMLKRKHDMYQILTPQQRETLRQERAQRMQQWEARKAQKAQ